MTRILALTIILIFTLPNLFAQPTLSFDLKKPQKYENRKLASEKTEDRKFHAWRAFTQNGTTKFNFHYNAYKKLADVIARGKSQHKDDYTRLLSFYNYDLSVTAKDKTELDSVIYKANAAILLHDLRNSWVDNMYMLMGQAYYFKNVLDSAYYTFQYINYAFSPKEKDGYDKPIGSNANADQGGSVFSISTKENPSLLNKAWSRPPSRNESLIWQVRTFLAKDELPEAAGLIETLKHDPLFPARLKTDLREMQALWFYKQQLYDSAAYYLELALDNAEGREEKARWEFLIGQLYDRANKPNEGAKWFERTVSHTLNPVLEIYARLNTIRDHKGDDKILQENIKELEKMARKDRYLVYRDIIYYAAAEMELERNNIPGAKALLLKATSYPGDDPAMRSKVFLLLGDLCFKEKNYPDAKRFYDSITSINPSVIDVKAFNKLKGTLGKIVAYQNTIHREDSLQQLAAMPEDQLEAYLKKLAKQLRKKQGVKEDDNGEPSGGPLSFNDNSGPSDLFSSSNQKGEWYFYNATLKAKGYTEFRGQFGNRPNVDNWQRLAAIKQATPTSVQNDDPAASGNAASAGPLTYEELLKAVPLTPPQLTASNDSVERSQFLLGKTYLDGLEDYRSTIDTLEAFLTRFPTSKNRPEALFMLAYCYYKIGEVAKATAAENELKQKYPGTSFEKIVSSANGVTPDSTARLEMNRRYDNIYNLYIEGRFDEAQAEKKMADSMYHENYWTPQLLYIQSVYYIQQRQDDSAKKSLQDIIRVFPGTPMAAKAKTLIDVLGRRRQIEDYLTRLEIQRPAEDSTGEPVAIVTPPPVRQQQPVGVVQPAPTQQQQPPVVTQPAQQQPVKPAVTQQPPPTVPATQQPKQDVAKTEKPAVKPAEKPVVTPPPAAKPTVTLPPPPIAKKDSVKAKVEAPKPLVLTHNAEIPHYVAIVLDKVDPVYINEARNAFNRYNREQYSAKGFTVNNQTVTDDIKLVLIGTFLNANEAIAYIDKTKKLAATEIIPWLPAAKYSFVIITENNLQVLMNTKDVNALKNFLNQNFPGKF
ncbi:MULTISPECIES: type IX secretion system periplasmic lipoprotein PorW/SprE [Niastella]|uniref:Tetratricopeptide repeat protein n=1 Tax=Niastella soli TaxID=2821487 RepID=A0ABS3Z4H0_9BACT|nr:tetratricopeptide repeat protein [Niastella soli]MBO9205064.1 tetratricopeptide repeat protein [Niastella soli]